MVHARAVYLRLRCSSSRSTRSSSGAGPYSRHPLRTSVIAAARATQIGQNEPSAPVAAQIAVHSRKAPNSPPVSCSRRRWSLRRALRQRRALLLARGRERRQVRAQGAELALGARRVGGGDALVELLLGQAPGGEVVADLGDRALALLVGGAEVGRVGHDSYV